RDKFLAPPNVLIPILLTENGGEVIGRKGDGFGDFLQLQLFERLVDLPRLFPCAGFVNVRDVLSDVPLVSFRHAADLTDQFAEEPLIGSTGDELELTESEVDGLKRAHRRPAFAAMRRSNSRCQAASLRDAPPVVRHSSSDTRPLRASGCFHAGS